MKEHVLKSISVNIYKKGNKSDSTNKSLLSTTHKKFLLNFLSFH